MSKIRKSYKEKWANLQVTEYIGKIQNVQRVYKKEDNEEKERRPRGNTKEKLERKGSEVSKRTSHNYRGTDRLYRGLLRNTSVRDVGEVWGGYRMR